MAFDNETDDPAGDPGAASSSGFLRRFRIGRSTQPVSPEEKEDRAIFQTQVLVVAAAFLLPLVWILLHHGYERPRELPVVFLVAMGAVMVLGGLSGFAETWMGISWSLGKRLTGDENGTHVPDFVGSLRAVRQRVQPRLVYVLTAVTVVGFCGLVVDTGLSIESPYIPLITAPAVFGPFVAREGSTAGALIAIVAILLIVITLLFPGEACDTCLDLGEVSQQLEGSADPGLRQLAGRVELTEQYRPKPGVFLTVGFVFLALAGLISIGRLRTERDLKRAKSELTADRERLLAHQRQLIALLISNGGTVPGEIIQDAGASNDEDEQRRPESA
jgi:hypothetical protein